MEKALQTRVERKVSNYITEVKDALSLPYADPLAQMPTVDIEGVKKQAEAFFTEQEANKIRKILYNLLVHGT